jgi:NTP pyrophosphatase (non-canonical NTP hydrolase)
MATKDVGVDYDQFVDSIWFYTPAGHGGMPELGYIGLKLAGECGEIAEKIGKAYRDNGGKLPSEELMLKELGDVAFYITKLSHLLGKRLGDVLMMNVEKLEDRKLRGTLNGNGDER